MQCYYHNVAKYKEENASGFWLWAKDKHFWIEYSGVVTLGIDTSQVYMEIDGDTVTITPNHKLLHFHTIYHPIFNSYSLSNGEK